mgnify:CR=1 FL=1
MEDRQQAQTLIKKVIENTSQVIIGKEGAIELGVIALFSQGHILIEDVPGVGKTMLAKSIAKSTGCEFKRLQFTPDMLPSDITGTNVYNQSSSNFEFRPGPIMSQMVLVDEINRATPKTQSALLEAMEEHQVSIDGVSYDLPVPFMILATQNPIEYEGTFPLPEAQLDRFMFIINVDYPTMKQEVEIAMTTTSGIHPDMDMVLNAKQVQKFQQLVPSVPVSEHVAEYAVRLAQSSRPNKNGVTLGFINEWVDWGAGPRASQYLLMGAKARALMDNRVAATIEDIKHVSRQVLEHRIVLNFRAEAENITTNDIIEKLLNSIKP